MDKLSMVSHICIGADDHVEKKIPWNVSQWVF
jgi:hypothetical protein